MLIIIIIVIIIIIIIIITGTQIKLFWQRTAHTWYAKKSIMEDAGGLVHSFGRHLHVEVQTDVLVTMVQDDPKAVVHFDLLLTQAEEITNILDKRNRKVHVCH